MRSARDISNRPFQGVYRSGFWAVTVKRRTACPVASAKDQEGKKAASKKRIIGHRQIFQASQAVLRQGDAQRYGRCPH